jgi:DNA-binding transcriptional ArsR family regulator
MKEASYKLFFKAFSNKTRFAIVRLLRKGPKSVTEICRDAGFEQSRVSHNLKCLENCGFVDAKWNGKNKIYELDKKHILPVLKRIDKYIETYNKRLKSCEILKK